MPHDELRGTDVVKDLFDLISRQYDDGWIPRNASEPRKKYLEYVRRELYRQQIKAKPKQRLNKAQIAQAVQSGSEKCVFAVWGAINNIEVYLHGYFNAASANMENPDIVIDDEGWIRHPEYPNLKMGMYK